MGPDRSEDRAGQEREWLAEQRLRAVLEVLDGSPVSEVAVRYGVSRQSVYTWKARHAAGGIDGLREVSRRPRTSPTRLAAGIEALVCELRRAHPRWGARRIAWELAQQGVAGAPSRATVHRVLVRNAMVTPQAQRHKRKYRRWQRETPMALWQLDLVGGVFLADGRECKLLSGIDDHSRYVVIATVLAVPSGRAVADAFVAAMKSYGVPAEVLTDIQDVWCFRCVARCPAGGVWRPGDRRLPAVVTDRSERAACVTSCPLITGRAGAPPRMACPVENPVTGILAGSLLANVRHGLPRPALSCHWW
jgi:transposase